MNFVLYPAPDPFVKTCPKIVCGGVTDSGADISKANQFLAPVFVSETLDFSYYLLKLLQKIGVVGVCGIPGTKTLSFNQQSDYGTASPPWQSFYVRHEGNGGFIANGSVYASQYTTRRFIMAYGTTGPGTSNLVTSLAEAMSDGIPSIFLVPQSTYVESTVDPLWRNRQIQTLQANKILGGCAKSLLLMDPTTIATGQIIDNIQLAFQRAFSYEPGPIVLIAQNEVLGYSVTTSIAAILSAKIAAFPDLFNDPTGIRLKPQYEVPWPDPVTDLFNPTQWSMLQAAFQMSYGTLVIQPSNYNTFLTTSISSAKKPLVVIGRGAFVSSLGIEPIMAWIHKHGLPYTVSMPVSTYGDITDPLFTGYMGHTGGTYSGNMAANDCDWVLCIGISFNYYQIPSNDSFVSATSIVSLNQYPQLTNVPYITAYLISDASVILNWTPPTRLYTPWIQQFAEWKTTGTSLLAGIYYPTTTSESWLKYGTVIEQAQIIADNFIQKNPLRTVWVVTDVGMHQTIVMDLFIFRNSSQYRWVSNYKLASIGSGLGTAMGIAITHPDDMILLFHGDTGFQQASSDLITINEAVITNMVMFVFDNSGIALVAEEEQELSLPALPYANGYIQTPDWNLLFAANLIPFQILTSTDQALRCLHPFVTDHFGTSTCVVVCVMEYNIYNSPYTAIGSLFSSMTYIHNPPNDAFQSARCNLITFNGSRSNF